MNVTARLESLLDHLKQGGYRQTVVRRALMEVLVATEKPLAVNELIEAFAAKGIRANKTTLYRELTFLQERGIVTDVRFNERQVRYELAGAHGIGHHHHVVCTACGKVEDIEIPGDLATMERHIEQQTQFTIERHSLEFFGQCQPCSS